MKIVKQPQTYREFRSKNEEEITNMVKEIVDKSFKENPILKTIKTLLFTGIAIIFLGVILAIIGFSLLTSSSEITPTIILLIIGVIVGVIGFLISWLGWRKKQKFFAEIEKELNDKQIFNQALGKLKYKIMDAEALKLDGVAKKGFEKALKSSVFDWAQYIVNIGQIPKDATVFSASDMLYIEDEWKNSWLVQQVIYHYVRTRRDSKGNVTYVNCYEPFFLLEGEYANTRKEDNDFEFSLGKRPLLNAKQKANIELENKLFNKQMKVYTNNELKTRMIFTPLSMETLLKHKESDELGISKLFGMHYHNHIVQAWFKPNGNVMEIDFPKLSMNKDKIIRYIANDVMRDVYSIYWVFSFMSVPPYFC